MSLDFLFYIAESESQLLSRTMLKNDEVARQWRRSEANSANMTICYRNVWSVSKAQLMERKREQIVYMQTG
jgi:hypothetical protein